MFEKIAPAPTTMQINPTTAIRTAHGLDLPCAMIPPRMKSPINACTPMRDPIQLIFLANMYP